MKTEQLLTQEFIDFSQKVAEIYHLKETKVKEFKELYVAHKAEIAELEAKVTKLKEEFDGTN